MGGVQVNGTDEYRRRCAEIAAIHGIRITKPEPRGIKTQKGHDTAERAKAAAVIDKKTRPTRLAERRKANAEIIAGLLSRRKELEEALDTEAKIIADTAIEEIKHGADEKRKQLETAKTLAESAVREIEGKEPVKGLSGFGYNTRKSEWDKLLKMAKADDASAGKRWRNTARPSRRQ